MTSTVTSTTSAAPEAGRAKIHISGTSLSFGSGPRAIEVLRDINLKINDGEFVTLIGPSGSGKSRLLNLISDTLGHVETSVSGSIEIDWQSNARSRLGYILQKDTLLPWRTLIENVEIGLELQGVSKQKRKDVAGTWIRRVGLGGFELAYPHQLSGGMRPDAQRNGLTFGPLGYAQAARQSYAAFSRLKRDGVIHAGCKFQVAIPTPYNVIDQRVDPDDRLAVEGPYEDRILAEIDEIAATVPHHELAIQWDAAHEVQNLEGGRPHWFDDPEPRMVERLVRLGNRVPAGVELGYHFCYGSLGGVHIVEPKDTSTMVRLSNAVCQEIGRTVEYLHMPVPRYHTDPAFFAPLKELRIGGETELYLGLIHLADGVDGAQRRIGAARSAVETFGIAAECGFGRATPDEARAILETHARVADLAAEAA